MYRHGCDFAFKKNARRIKGFNIQIEAEMSEEHPKQYTSMNVIYEFEGDNLPREKLKKAVSLSFENYCGVMAMYKKAFPITYEIRIKD